MYIMIYMDLPANASEIPKNSDIFIGFWADEFDDMLIRYSDFFFNNQTFNKDIFGI